MGAPKGNKYALGNKGGRPSTFTPELGRVICERLAAGETLRKICKDDDMPDVSTVIVWVAHPDKKEFATQYARARMAQAQHYFDDLLSIADDDSRDATTAASVARDRLRVDTRKWYLSKVLPKIYGDKVDLTTNGKDLPTPILPLSHVHSNNGNKQDSADASANTSGTGGDVVEQDGVDALISDSESASG